MEDEFATIDQFAPDRPATRIGIYCIQDDLYSARQLKKCRRTGTLKAGTNI
jgi:hypothetical protein